MTRKMYTTLFAMIDELVGDAHDAYEIHGTRTTERSRGQPDLR